MAGVVVTVLPKTSFDFGGVTAGTSSANVPLGLPLDVTQYTNVGVALRIHASSIGASSEVEIALLEDGFLDGSAEAFPGNSDAFIGISSSDVAPCARFSYQRINSQYASLVMSVYRGVLTDPVNFTISADVYMRNGDETAMVFDNGVWRPTNVDASGLFASSGGMPSIGRVGGAAISSGSGAGANTSGGGGTGTNTSGGGGGALTNTSGGGGTVSTSSGGGGGGGGGGGLSGPRITISQIDATPPPMQQALIFAYMQQNNIPFIPVDQATKPATALDRIAARAKKKSPLE
jgi:hypothetical protein